MVTRRLLLGVLLAALLLGIAPLASRAEPGLPEAVLQSGNRARNPGFEGLSCDPGSPAGWCYGNWTHDAHDGSVHGNIFTPQGWVTWWRKGGGYGQPEVKTIPRVPPFTGELERIRSGNYAVLLFTFWRLQDTGLYQVVSGLQSGSTVEFSAYAQGWSCNTDDRIGYSCGDPYNQQFQVGIEPHGIANPFAASVVWSPEQLSPDAYRRIGPVRATVGSAGRVTILLRSKTKWAFKYGDAYWDDARLVVLGPGQEPTATPRPQPTNTPKPQPTNTPRPQPTNTPRPQPTNTPRPANTPPPQPTNTPVPTAAPPATPVPSGGTVHVVVAGDTLYAISRRYGVSVQDLVQANGIVNPSLIYVGQRITIPGGAPGPAPTPVPSGGTVHVVQPGETLTRISLRYGVSIWTIVNANGISNPNLIYVGQRLRIPGR